jgi:hypothetical protein
MSLRIAYSESKVKNHANIPFRKAFVALANKTYSHPKTHDANFYRFFYSFGWILTALCEQQVNNYKS